MTGAIEYGHIVLVEDDQGLAELTCAYLSKQGYRMTHIDNGPEAIERIVQLNPDCVLLDVMLPGTDGVEVCRQVRPHYSGPIVFLTAKDDTIDEIMGLEVGGDDYLIKPVDPRKLLARVRAHLRRQPSTPVSESSAQATITFDDIDHRMLIGDTAISYPEPEYKLVKLLVEHAQSPIDRDTIMLTLRGIEYDGLSRTVDILISGVRKKLPDPEWIKTLRGKGYIWVGPGSK